jgi:hypothetical protein
MEGTPICVLLDGRDVPEDLRRAPDVRVLRRDDVKPSALRSVFGSLRAKNAALWASPFETFLLLDADSVVWGDLRTVPNFDRFDFVVDSDVEPLRAVMDPELVARHIADFDARAHASRFVNTGAYFGRRNVLDLDEYLGLLRLSTANPGMFYGSQGTFNLMIHRAAERGDLRLERRELQLMTGRASREEVVRRCGFADSRPVVSGAPLVLHWVGSPKPRVREGPTNYFRPMTYFRLEFRRSAHGGRPRRTDLLQLRLEDALCTDWRGTNLRGRWGKVRRRADQRWAAWRVTLRAHVPDGIVSRVNRKPRPPAS